jgi:hypothetical protein
MVSVYDIQSLKIMSQYKSYGTFDRSTIGGESVYLWDSNPTAHENINKNKVPIISIQDHVITPLGSEVGFLCNGPIQNAWYSHDGSLSVWDEYCPFGNIFK